jgi:predicted metalloprotease
MQFDDDAQLDSGQVRDERGSGPARGGGPGGGFGLPGGRGGLAGLLLVVIAALVGVPLALTDGSGTSPNAVSADGGNVTGTVGTGALAAKCRTGADANAGDDCRVVAIVNSVQNYWTGFFAANNQKYPPAQTVIFSGSTRTGCGTATSAVGPFYCPTDRTAYLDLGFWQELTTKFGARGGPFAQAYVLAHEYGHHIQNLTGVLRNSQSSKQGANSGAVRVELQADCYAGLWAHSATTTKDANGRVLIRDLTKQDISDGLDAASAVGDDRIQAQYQGRVTPETWTHGSAAQRQKWFLTGYQTGDFQSCDTFSGAI